MITPEKQDESDKIDGDSSTENQQYYNYNINKLNQQFFANQAMLHQLNQQFYSNTSVMNQVYNPETYNQAIAPPLDVPLQGIPNATLHPQTGDVNHEDIPDLPP